MRNGLLIGFALFIDIGLQLLFGLGIIALQLLPIVGQLATPLAVALSTVVSFCFGAALVMALIFTGLFSWGAILGGSFVEMIPFLNMLMPGWTLVVIRCIAVEKKRLKATQVGSVTIITDGAPAVRQVDGIRAAAGNDTYYEAQAAA